MTQLEKLTLSFVVQNRPSFIDGNHLNNEILSHMPYLHTFIFDIVTEYVVIEEDQLPTYDDIRRPLVEKGHNTDCYIDYDPAVIIRCHLYSVPLDMHQMHFISNNFPGGLFIHVRILRLMDIMNPFEHDFFARISSSFPFVESMIICSTEKQKYHRRPSSIIEYSHLRTLDLTCGHIDYVRQFLYDTKTRLPSLKKLRIRYKHLIAVTKNFTNDTTRPICAQLKLMIFQDPMVYAKTFELYPPNVYVYLCSD